MTKKKLLQRYLSIEDLQPGDVLLFPPNTLSDGGWVGQAIVLLTDGSVSHSAIFCGEKDGELRVAHAAPAGITSESFKTLVASEPGCYVKRRIMKTNLDPVLTAVDKYTDHDNPYPFLNLGILGLLLLTKRISERTLLNRIFYDFALLVGLKIMKEVEKNRHPGKKPMSCSQFAAQCFTDAGNEYDIKFNELLIQFGALDSNTEKSSLLDMLRVENIANKYKIRDIDLESVLIRENQIASSFIKLLRKGRMEINKPVDKQELGAIGEMLLKVLCEAMTGTMASSIEHAVELFSTNRNYYVTPDDLLSNTKNLTDIGYLDKSVL